MEPIEIVDYDPAWPAFFRQHSFVLARAFGSEATSIDHIGSTSVPGLAAKPFIDIQIGVEILESGPYYLGTLRSLGYVERDSGEPEVRLVYHRTGSPGFNLHIVEHNSWAYQRTLLFRDYLRTHPELAGQYETLKRKIMSSFTNLDAYTVNKTDFVEGVIEEAAADRAIPYNPGNARP